MLLIQRICVIKLPSVPQHDFEIVGYVYLERSGNVLVIQGRVSSRNQVPLEWLAVRDMDTQLNQG